MKIITHTMRDERGRGRMKLLNMNIMNGMPKVFSCCCCGLLASSQFVSALALAFFFFSSTMWMLFMVTTLAPSRLLIVTNRVLLVACALAKVQCITQKWVKYGLEQTLPDEHAYHHYFHFDWLMPSFSISFLSHLMTMCVVVRRRANMTQQLGVRSRKHLIGIYVYVYSI